MRDWRNWIAVIAFVLSIIAMMILGLLGMVGPFFISGCAHHGGHHHAEATPTPRPKPTIAPPVNADAVIRDGMLYIGGKRALAIGLYDLAVNTRTWPDEAAVESTASAVSNAGYNLARIWVRFFFKPGDLSPWVVDAQGDSQLGQLDPVFFARCEMVGRVFRRHGVQVAWVVWDGWSLRQRDRFDPLAPDRHFDPFNPQLIWPLDWNHCCNDRLVSRDFWKCHREENQECQFGVDSFYSPAQWNLLRRVAQMAKVSGNLIYYWSEAMTDSEHATWDLPAFRYWISHADQIARTEYPGVILGISVADRQDETYRHVQIADAHGLGAGCSIAGIAGNVARIKAAAPNVVVCINTDGCMSSPRQDAAWLTDAGQRIYAAGAFPEFLSEWPISAGLLQAGRNLSGR